MKRAPFVILLLLLAISIYGLLSYIFDMSGLTFVAELVVLIGVMFFALISLLLVFGGATFGYVLSTLVSLVLMLNLLVLYFNREMSSVLFAALISAITAFILSIVSIRRPRAAPLPPLPAPEKVETPPAPKKATRTKTAKKKARKKTSARKKKKRG